MTASRIRRALVPTVVLVVVAALAVLFRGELVAWFTGDSAEPPPEPPATTEPVADTRPTAPDLGPQTFDEATLGRLQVAFAAYDAVRAKLATDVLDGVASDAHAVATAIDAAAQSQHAPAVQTSLASAQTAAHEVASASTLEAARAAFGELSMQLVALGAADPRMTEGWHVFSCPMTQGFSKWLQRSPTLENPYMGQAMLACGSEAAWAETSSEPSSHEGHDEIAHYTCPMHPSVQQKTPGQCPICGMDLVPVTRGELESGTIVVDQTRRQRIGVRSAPAQPRPLTLDLRAVGEVTYDETRLTDVNLRVSGWVEKLVVDKTGQPVKKGQTLFTLYSPELYTTQLEYLAVAGKSGSTTVSELARVTRTKLSLLGMTAGQIRALERRGTGQENVAFASPASGYVLEKNIVEGARIESGTQVYRIADLSRVWVDAQVYEPDLPYVHVGQPARVELPYVPGRTYEGKVDFIYPTLEEATRTGKVRIVVDNPELELKPQMYASVVFEVDLGERLAVPVSAVVFTGPRRLVFVDLGEGRLRPQPVELGARTEGWYEVTDGLEAGDIVVTSGTFLIAAESRLRSALEFWEGEPVDARQ